MEDTAGGNSNVTGIAIVLAFLLMLLPALLVTGVLAGTGVRTWWAYAAGGVAAALLANVIFVGEFNTRLILFSGTGGIVGGLAAFLYLKYVGRLWEAAHA
jgi:hypothetical protein